MNNECIESLINYLIKNQFNTIPNIYIVNYTITKEIIELLEQFENENIFNQYSSDTDGFKNWIYENWKSEKREVEEPY